MRWVFVVMVAGCSFVGGRPGAAHPGEERTCSLAPPILDTIAAVATVAFVGTFLPIGVEHSHGPGLYALGIAAFPFVISALYGYDQHAYCRRLAHEDVARAERARVDGDRQQAQRARLSSDILRGHTRDQAIAVMATASAAARSGDCATVVTLDGQLSALDADFQDSVFVRDVAIDRCLAP